MKQRITPEQLQELTSEQQEALRKWWKPEEWELIYVTNKGLNTFGQAMRITGINPACDSLPMRLYVDVGGWCLKSEVLPLLSIGQCIELLNNKTNEQSFGYNDSGCFWTIFMGNRGIGNMVEGSKGRQFSSYELVDALWIAVKELLQKPL